MPIYFNPENKSWEPRDLTEAEQKALIEIATQELVHFLGEQTADKIMSHFKFVIGPELEDIPAEEMGRA